MQELLDERVEGKLLKEKHDKKSESNGENELKGQLRITVEWKRTLNDKCHTWGGSGANLGFPWHLLL